MRHLATEGAASRLAGELLDRRERVRALDDRCADAMANQLDAERGT
ncbi:MAG: hypothetical protein LC744_00030 [Chloroflexi bacterium]|nr:hypothetical protein [Chloroflexota bacterium]